MAEVSRVPKGRYRHLIGGEVNGRRHEAGDLVNPSTPPRKLREWLDAGVIQEDKTTKRKEAQ